METTTNTNNNVITSQDNDQLLIQIVKISASNVAKTQHSLADIRSLLSKKNERSGNIDKIIYKVKDHDASSDVSLVNRGNNGGITGKDILIALSCRRARYRKK